MEITLAILSAVLTMAVLLRTCNIAARSARSNARALDRVTENAERTRDHITSLLQAGAAVQEARIEVAILQIIADTVHRSGWASVAAHSFHGWEKAHSAFSGLSEKQIECLSPGRVTAEKRAAMDPDLNDLLLLRLLLRPSCASCTSWFKSDPRTAVSDRGEGLNHEVHEAHEGRKRRGGVGRVTRRILNGISSLSGIRHGHGYSAVAAPMPATYPLAHAHWKLNPPMRPSTSQISPAR